MKSPVVAVALSGGVDSLVTGFLLKQKYKNIFGIHFTTGYETEPADIVSLEKQLGFPVHVVDLTIPFEKHVVQYFIHTYLEGKTPNPCLICNKTIKFGALLDHAISMGADCLATGHYASVINSFSSQARQVRSPYLVKGKDPLKDQSYFLSLLSSRQLDKIIFPLADMTKDKVQLLARSEGIKPLHQKESQDICFIHDRNLSGFILEKQGLLPKPGNIIDIDSNIIGKHQGLHRFTIGQRKGINCPASEPYYVKTINMKTNELVVCFKKDLTTKTMYIENINWNDNSSGKITDLEVKIRYSHKGASCELDLEKSSGRVYFKKPQKAVTPGQAAVFYKKNNVLGAGIIQ